MKVIAALMVLAGLLMGCGGTESTTTEAPTPAPPPSPIKSVMESIEQTGEIPGSGMNFEDEVAKLKSADAQKGAKLEKDLGELIQLTEPDAIKAKAKQIADGL